MYYTLKQLKMPIELARIIKISDPVYKFCEVMDGIDLKKYLAIKKSGVGRKRYNAEVLLKIVLFAFMENGYASVREIEKLCKTDIREMSEKVPILELFYINHHIKIIFLNLYLTLSAISLYLKKSENIANFLAFPFGESVGVADDRGHKKQIII